MSDDDLIPVNVSRHGSRVSVLLLLELPDGSMALHADDRWQEIGHWYASVERGINAQTNVSYVRDVIAWEYDTEYGRASGTTKTQKAAVDAIVAAGGFREVPDTATIPDLLEGLT